MLSMIFKPAARYPADPRVVFILALSVFSGLTSLAVEAAPASLEALLPHWVVLFWSSLLIFGSALALVGIMIQSVNGIVLEQIGSMIVAAATIFYGVLAIYFAGPAAIQGVSIIIAWGLACLYRWGQLQVLLVSAHRRQVKQDIVDKIHRELMEFEEKRRAGQRKRFL